MATVRHAIPEGQRPSGGRVSLAVPTNCPRIAPIEFVIQAYSRHSRATWGTLQVDLTPLLFSHVYSPQSLSLPISVDQPLNHRTILTKYQRIGGVAEISS
jgi:hypothetical protein